MAERTKPKLQKFTVMLKNTNSSSRPSSTIYDRVVVERITDNQTSLSMTKLKDKYTANKTWTNFTNYLYLSDQDRKYGWICYVTHACDNSSWLANKISHTFFQFHMDACGTWDDKILETEFPTHGDTAATSTNHAYLHQHGHCKCSQNTFSKTQWHEVYNIHPMQQNQGNYMNPSLGTLKLEWFACTMCKYMKYRSKYRNINFSKTVGNSLDNI